MGRRHQEGSKPSEGDAENCRLRDCLSVQHCEGIARPLLNRWGIRRSQRVRKPDTPQVEPNQP